MVTHGVQNGDSCGWTTTRGLPMIDPIRAAAPCRTRGWQEATRHMVRVLVIGDHDVATAPVRQALAEVPGVEVVVRPLRARNPSVDTIVIDQTLGTRPAAEGLRALATLHPAATLLVIELLGGEDYRWVHLQPQGADFRVYDAGTGPLARVLATSLAPVSVGPGPARHAMLPAMPCSTA
jgi:hypothetical protein